MTKTKSHEGSQLELQFSNKHQHPVESNKTFNPKIIDLREQTKKILTSQALRATKSF